MKSDNVKSGMQSSPHRSLFNALGFTEEEMKKTNGRYRKSSTTRSSGSYESG